MDIHVIIHLLKLFVLLLSISISSSSSSSSSWVTSACVPLSGYTALIIGQDYYSITNYTSSSVNTNLPHVKGNTKTAWGTMSYTSLKGGSGGDLGGLLTPVNYGSGVEWAEGLTLEYPGSALQLGLWFVGNEGLVAEGLADKNINKLLSFIEDMTISHRLNDYDNDVSEYDNDIDFNNRKRRKKGVHRNLRIEIESDSNDHNTDDLYHRSPLLSSSEDGNEKVEDKKYQDMSFYIRIGYEFDNPDNNYDPTAYKTAFRRIVDKFRDYNLTNVAFVWHSYGGPVINNNTFMDWYPGYEYVDWCGISIFKQPYECQTALKCEMSYIEEFATFCTNVGHPIMIAESTPFGGILEEKTASLSPSETNEAGISGSSWNRWFLPVIQFIERHDIRIWSYINCNWDAQPMWAKNHGVGEAWGDTRIEAHPDIMEKWKQLVLSSRRFAWSIGTTSNRVCAKESKRKDNNNDDDMGYDEDNGENVSKFYHITILGYVIILDPLVIGILLSLIVAYIVRVMRKRQRPADRWGYFDILQIIGLRSRGSSYTIIN